MSHSDLHFPHLTLLSDAARSFGRPTGGVSIPAIETLSDHQKDPDRGTESTQVVDSGPDAQLRYSALEITGADAAVFLNGQLTTDVIKLPAGTCQTSAVCNLKGRVIAQFELVRADAERFVLITRHSLIDTLATTLSRYILRSKVRVSPSQAESGFLLVQAANTLPPGSAIASGDHITCRPAWLPTQENWVMSNDPTVADAVQAHGNSAEETSPPDLSWAHAHVLSGVAPPVTGQELEHIPQMLNLDALNGVSVTKGCYTGQEIISRVHHRGSVKRRLRRFTADRGAAISVGDPVTTPSDSRAGVIVEVAVDGELRPGVLAVVKESAFTDGETGSDSGLTCGTSPLMHWALPYTI